MIGWGRGLLLAMGLAMPGAAFAQSETSWAAETYGSAGWSANPFVGAGDASSGFVQFGLRPQARIRTERDTIDLAADIQIQQYFRRYSTRDNYNVRLDYTGKPAERVSTRLGVRYSNTIAGAFFDGRSIADPGTPVTPVTPDQVPDIGLFGTNNRRQLIDLRPGVDVRLSESSQLQFTSFVTSNTNSDNRRAANFLSYGGNLGYANRLSSRITVGVEAAAGATDYERGLGSTRVYSARGTVDLIISPRWKLNGALGATFLNTGLSNVSGVQPATVTLSGRISLCGNREFDTLCFIASRDVLPSSFAGTSAQTAISATYRRRVSRYGRINLQSSYSDIELGQLQLLGSATRYLQSSAEYSQILGKRLSMTASTFYRAVYGGNLTRGDDYGGQVGFTYRFGDLR